MNSWIHFNNLEMLHLLWIVPALGAFLYLAGRHGRRALERVTRVQGLTMLDPARRRVRTVLYLSALILLVVALLRPGWNPKPVQVHQEGRDVIFVIDVSRSMLARDLAPNRLERAKLAILDVLPVLEGDRVGVVAFAGSATVVCPLTRDYGFFRWAVEGLSPASTPHGGTLMGDAIRKVSEDVFDPREKRYKDVLLISDGEDQNSFPVEAAALAGEQGVRIIAVGLGDEVTGSRIPLGDSPTSQQFLEDEGREVWTRLHPEVLRQVALATPGGRYLHAATGVFDLGEIYRELVAHEAGRELGELEIVQYQEKFQLFLAAVFCLLVLEMLIGEVKSPLHATDVWEKLGILLTLKKRQGGSAPALLAALLTGLLAAMFFGSNAPASAAGSVPDQVSEGNTAYRHGAYHNAAARYENAREEHPDSPVPLFNMGVALFQQENYHAALNAFQSLQEGELLISDRRTAALVHYNQGNTLARMGQQAASRFPQEALQLYDRSISAYRRALDLNPRNTDAAYNIEVVRHWIEELRGRASERAGTKGEQRSERRPSSPGERPPQDQQPPPPEQSDPDDPGETTPDQPQTPEAPQDPVRPQDGPGIPRDETAQSILEEEQRRREAEAKAQGGSGSHGRPTW